MKNNKRNEFRNREFEKFYTMAGKTIKYKFIVGTIFSHVFFNLLLVLWALAFNRSSKVMIQLSQLITVLSVISLFVCLSISWGAYYYRQVILIQLITTTVLTLQFFIVGLYLLLITKEVDLQIWVISGFGIGIIFALSNINQEPYKWEETRKQGKLKEYLDEGAWTFKFNIPNTIERILVPANTYKNKWRILARFEKLHYLMPAIGVMLSRNFPDQRQVLVGICALTIGLIFFAHLQIPLYIKILQWEKEKGKPLLLHESWNKKVG